MTSCPNCPYDIILVYPVTPPLNLILSFSKLYISRGISSSEKNLVKNSSEAAFYPIPTNFFYVGTRISPPPPLPGPAPAPIQPRSPHPALPLPARLGLALSATCNRSFASVPFFFRTYRFLYLAMLVLLIFSSLEGKIR